MSVFVAVMVALALAGAVLGLWLSAVAFALVALSLVPWLAD